MDSIAQEKIPVADLKCNDLIDLAAVEMPSYDQLEKIMDEYISDSNGMLEMISEVQESEKTATVWSKRYIDAVTFHHTDTIQLAWFVKQLIAENLRLRSAQASSAA